jgi:AcrR family transcriptional regulator
MTIVSTPRGYERFSSLWRSLAEGRSVGRVSSGRETADLILAEARAMIEESGDNAFRVTDLASRCNVAIGLLYHYFKDRDGLIAAVRESQFLAHIESDVAMLSNIVSHEGDLDAVLKILVDDFSDPRNKMRNEFRLDRMDALVAARHNPDLLQRLTEAEARLTTEIIATVQQAKIDGLVDPAVDDKALAFMLEVIPLGTALSNVYGDYMPDPEAWRALLTRMLVSLLPPS